MKTGLFPQRHLPFWKITKAGMGKTCRGYRDLKGFGMCVSQCFVGRPQSTPTNLPVHVYFLIEGRILLPVPSGQGPWWLWQSRCCGEDVDSPPLVCCGRIKAEL